MAYNTFMESYYFETRIHRSLLSTPVSNLQNRISSFPDRDLAIALDILCPEDRSRITAALPPAKLNRIRQEQVYLGGLRITAAQKRLMAEHLADTLEGRQNETRRTWIAPGGRT